MRVSLIGDTSYPYIPFQKISSYHKHMGDTIGLDLPNPDLVYMSVMFTWNKPMMMGKKKLLEAQGVPVVIGGSGYDVKSDLLVKFAYQHPDPELYGHLDYCFGFITRGCVRRCSFCIVPQKEGIIRFMGYDWINKPKVVLYDNNLLAYKNHEQVLRYLAQENLKVCFNQGLDIRLITESNAKLLADLDYRSLNFKVPRLYFAFDQYSPQMTMLVKQKIQILNKAGIPSRHLMFYMIYGVEENPLDSFNSLWLRYNVIKRLGAKPYPMNYRRGDRRYRLCHDLARWTIRRYDQFLSFSQYCEGLK
jgi:hypothetical protein